MGAFKIVFAPAIKPALGAAPLDTWKQELIAERAGLPPSLVHEPKGFLPLHAIEYFLDLLQEEVGDPDFLFRSLGTDPEEHQKTHSVVGIDLPGGTTGLEALQNLTATFCGFITGTRYFIELRGDLIWVLRSAGATDWSDKWPVLEYNLSIMLSGARRTVGRLLSPAALQLPFATEGYKLPEELGDLPIKTDKNNFGVALRVMDIISANFELFRPQGNAKGMDLGLPHEAVAHCLSQYVTSATTDRLSERVARSFGLSARSYRRHLAAMGTSHARLLSDVRLDLALRLLEDQTLAITEVSYELGFAHPGDFTRFFKRRMGVSPMKYRDKQCAPVIH